MPIFSSIRSELGISLAVVLGCLTLSSSITVEALAADKPPPVATTSPAAGTTPAPAATPAPTPVPQAESDAVHEEVEALETWFEPTPDPTPSKRGRGGANSPDRSEPQDAVEESLGISAASRSERERMQKVNPLKAAVIPSKISLSKAQKARLEKARLLEQQVIREQRKKFGVSFKRPDPRGKPELRICSVNLNGYGLAADWTKTFRSKKPSERLQVERSSLAAISQANCGVVALQAVFGLDSAKALEGLRQFAAKLEKRTGATWRVFVAESQKEIIRNGFMVRGDELNILSIKTFTNIRLLRFGEYQLERAPRPPMQIVIDLKGSEEVSRTLVITTFDLRTTSLGSEKPGHRLQLAEATRRVIDSQREESAGDDLTTYVLLGERGVSYVEVAARILEGTLQFLDLTKNGRCRLIKIEPPEGEAAPKKKKKKKNATPEPEHTFECSKPADYFKSYFGLLSETFGPPAKPVKKRVGDEEKWVLVSESKKAKRARIELNKARTNDIYIPAADLPLVFENAYEPGRYRVGDIPLRNGTSASPLIWVDLNW